MTTEELCEELLRHLETSGEEMFEKNFLRPDGEIAATIFCIVGPNSTELTALVREWAHNSGFKRTT